ncbi:MAG: histidine kinase [Clostridia bacterium]|nr:histidine kinase [Clostridia bacterium]
MKKNKIWNIITHYHWESAFFKHCFKWFLIVLIPTFIIGLCISIFTYYVTNKNIEQSNNFNFHTINQQTVSMFDKITDFHYSFSNDYNVLKLCLNMIENNNDLSITVQNVHSLITTFSSTHDNIHSIYMYNPSINRVIGSNYSSTLNEFYDSEWIGNDDTLSGAAFKKHDNSDILSLKRNIILNGNSIATVIYNIDLTTFTSSFISNTTIPVISFLSEDGDILYCSHNIDNTKTIGSYNTVIPNNLTLDVTFIRAKSDFIQIISFWVFWLTFLILIVVDVVLSYNLALNYFKLVVENIMQFQSLYSYNEESETLLEELNLMIHSPIKKTGKKDVEHFLINQYRQLNSSRITSLQEQINPHFIFNTLNLISLLEMDEDTSSGLISKITRNLSDILRYSIETSSNMVSFADEILYLDKYIEIQNLKSYGNYNF